MPRPMEDSTNRVVEILNAELFCACCFGYERRSGHQGKRYGQLFHRDFFRMATAAGDR